MLNSLCRPNSDPRCPHVEEALYIRIFSFPNWTEYNWCYCCNTISSYADCWRRSTVGLWQKVRRGLGGGTGRNQGRTKSLQYFPLLCTWISVYRVTHIKAIWTPCDSSEKSHLISEWLKQDLGCQGERISPANMAPGSEKKGRKRKEEKEREIFLHRPWRTTGDLQPTFSKDFFFPSFSSLSWIVPTEGGTPGLHFYSVLTERLLCKWSFLE